MSSSDSTTRGGDRLPPRPRGRPRKDPQEYAETREKLIRAGVVLLTEKGFASTGLEEVLKAVGVPKGSFYSYFDSKEVFGILLIHRYASYFEKNLDKCFLNKARTPMQRFLDFSRLAQVNMGRYKFLRGCLVGNLGQEMAVLPEAYRALLVGVFQNWQDRTATCFREAVAAGELPPETDCDAAAEAFWIGWEGAVLRSKLERGPRALALYTDYFVKALAPIR